MSRGDGHNQLRHTEPYQACVAVLDARGIPHRVEWGARHAKLIFEYLGRPYFKILSRSSPNWRAAKKAPCDIRRMLKEAERRSGITPERATVLQARPAPAQSQTFGKDETMDGSTPAVAESSADIGLHPIEGIPRVLDIDLGERLGLVEPRFIRRDIIEANRAELEGFGSLWAVPTNPGARGGRPGTVYYLTEEQALLVAVLSRAPRAREVRAMLIRVFVAWRKGSESPMQELSADVREVIGGIVKKVVVKQTEDIRAGIETAVEGLADVVKRLNALPAAPAAIQTVNGSTVTTYEIVANLAEIPPGPKHYRSLFEWVDREMLEFCALRGIRVSAHSVSVDDRLIMFPVQAVMEWFKTGGRKEMWARALKREERVKGRAVVAFPAKG